MLQGGFRERRNGIKRDAGFSSFVVGIVVSVDQYGVLDFVLFVLCHCFAEATEAYLEDIFISGFPITGVVSEVSIAS
jgi:hypothetical protein